MGWVQTGASLTKQSGDIPDTVNLDEGVQIPGGALSDTWPMSYGGQCRTRTCDLLLVRQAL